MWRKRWFRGVVYGIVVIGISVGLAYLLQHLMAQLDISQEKAAPLVYLIVFGSTLIMNTTILVPVPIATVIMMDAALLWNPILIALVTSIGGALGEMSGYYAGRLGKKIIVPESLIGCGRVAGWVNRYGPLTIFLFAFIPFLPFDIAGMVAGGSKMPLWKFLLPCWAGKFPKYILLCYAFKIGALHLLPGWFQ